MIALAGPSGSGKSAIAEMLAGRLAGADARSGEANPDGAAILPMDCYYYDLSPLPTRQREECNFDSPDSLDWLLLIEQIDAVAAGRAVAMPQYDFTTHTRRAERTQFQPGRYVIIDGLHALWDAHVRDLLTLGVFVDASSDLCLTRRLTRDISTRDRTAGEVISRYSRFVLPMCRQHVLPTRQYAGLVVSGEGPVDACVDKILARLAEK